MKKLLIIISLLLFSFPVLAQQQQQETYQYNRSIIYVFYNSSANKSSQKAIEMLQNLYNQKYQSRFDFYVINYETEYKENNYITTYHLSKPLEVVMAKVKNGKADGYRKIENLENRVSNQNTFNREVSNRIETFLGTGFTW